MRAALPLLALALAACANETSIPEASSFQGGAPPRTAEAPTPAAGPVTRYDGLYNGEVTLVLDRMRNCPQAMAGPRQIQVRQGRASLVINPQTGMTLTGMVGAEGSVRMAERLDRTIATSGVFSEDGFIGEYAYGLCRYSVQMRKA
ncbi:hypothetical protein JYK14_27205 [Siccirubricoccus sp. KC 17139]|uniref:Uncharacterized protein n=1 Tax=Siccirubricoccus soli TaxID=2899147 RepID=A0ABT1DD36_9PROT|nr:hypothetical protein [Siccirubricoccus soli]MCO6419824.1 hypothetical protein [Siccirubricoccus soli]MCP2685959.1 hypothetical protein [Siccirubricoccus soli]